MSILSTRDVSGICWVLSKADENMLSKSREIPDWKKHDLNHESFGFWSPPDNYQILKNHQWFSLKSMDNTLLVDVPLGNQNPSRFSQKNIWTVWILPICCSNLEAMSRWHRPRTGGPGGLSGTFPASSCSPPLCRGTLWHWIQVVGETFHHRLLGLLATWKRKQNQLMKNAGWFRLYIWYIYNIYI